MPPSKSWPVLILHQSGDLSQAQIQTTGALTLPAIQKFLKLKKGVECIATYKAKPLYLSLFGLSEGPEELQNQHQLPPPHDSSPVYGDVILVASKDSKSFESPIAFKPEDYEEFYTKMYDGGYDSEEDAPEEEDLEAAAGAADEEKEFGEDEEEAEEAEDEPEEDGEEGDAEDAEEGGDEEAPAPKTKAAAAKKKRAAAKSATTLTGTGSAYPNPPILSEAEQLQEEPLGSSATTVQTNPVRKRIICALGATMGAHLADTQIAELERAIYNGAIQQARQRHVVRAWDYPLFVHLYKMRAQTVVSNFHPESYVGNTELYEGYQRGELSIEAIAKMNIYELFPSHWRGMFEAQQIREKKQLEGNMDRATDQFTCTRCWKKQCTYYEMQTRSADEPMTIFITCLNCGKKWRQ